MSLRRSLAKRNSSRAAEASPMAESDTPKRDEPSSTEKNEDALDPEANAEVSATADAGAAAEARAAAKTADAAGTRSCMDSGCRFGDRPDSGGASLWTQ